MEGNILSNLEINQLIVKKAAEDEEFKLALLNDPKAAIQKQFAVVFPEDTRVEIHTESSKVLHLIIPAANADELTDDQLEDVAGGAAPFNPGGAVVAYGVQIPGGNGWRWPSF